MPGFEFDGHAFELVAVLFVADRFSSLLMKYSSDVVHYRFEHGPIIGVELMGLAEFVPQGQQLLS